MCYDAQKLGTKVLVWWQVPHMAAGVGSSVEPEQRFSCQSLETLQSGL